jgi:putative flippase GtrA
MSIIYNFILSRSWTRKDGLKKGIGLFLQFISFNLAVLMGISIRATSLVLFELFGINYVLNFVIGIGLAATGDFILYDI